MGVPPEIPKLMKFMEGHFGSDGKSLLFKAFSRASITPKMLATGFLSQQVKMNLIQHVMDDCFKESSVQSGTKLRMIEAQLAGIFGLNAQA